MKYYLLLLSLGFLFSYAAQPINDQCLTASSATIGNVISFNTSGSTNNGPIVNGDDIYHDIWYTFTADSNLRYTVSLCNSSFNTRLAVYEATNCTEIGIDTCIAFNDNYGRCSNNTNSELHFDASSGQTYYIRVGGPALSHSGLGEMLITTSAIPPPPFNDHCTNAEFLNVWDANYTCPNTTPYTTAGATLEDTTSNCGGNDYRAVWFQFVTGNNQDAVQININVGEFNEVLVEIMGDCSGTNVNASFTCGSFYQDNLINVNGLSPNTVYFLKVGTSVFYGFAEGPFGICLKELIPTDNDECINAKIITSEILETFNNSNATSNYQLGTSIGPVQKDLWYYFVAPFDITYSVSTCGTPYDTKIAVYQADSCSEITSFTEIVSNDNDIFCESNYANSYAQFQASADKKYYIRVGSGGSPFGQEPMSGPGQILLSNSDAEASLAFKTKRDFKIFPIPAYDIINFEFNNHFDKRISIMDQTGRNVLTLQSSQINERINIAQFESGIYYVEILHSEGRSTQKIIKH